MAVPGELLNRARLSRGRSQEAIAEYLGRDQTYVSKLENDKIEGGIKGDELLKLSTFLEYDPYVFIGQMDLKEGDLRHRERDAQFTDVVKRMTLLEQALKEKIPDQIEEDPLVGLLRRPEIRELLERVKDLDRIMLARLTGAAIGVGLAQTRDDSRESAAS